MTENNKKALYLLMVVFLALLGGVVGELFSRAYLIEKFSKIPMFGELNFNATDYNKSNIVISNPKKVVIEQSERVAGIANSAKSGMAGIYLKKQEVKKESKAAFSLNDYYAPKDELAQGYVITADGWILSRFAPEELMVKKDEKQAAKKDQKNASKEQIFAKYEVIVNGKIFKVKNIIIDGEGGYCYWQVEASDLPVQAILSAGEIMNGDLVLLVNKYGQVWMANTYGKLSNVPKNIKSSDDLFDEVFINNAPTDVFINSFVFNLDGEFLGILNDKKNITVFQNSSDIVFGLVKSAKFAPAKLGIYYVELANLVENNVLRPNKIGAIIVRNDKGVAIEKGSLAEKVGLKEGDVIVSIGGTEINKDNYLKSVLSKYKVGDQVDVIYLRSSNESIIKLKF